MRLSQIRRLPRRAQNKAMAILQGYHCRRARAILEERYPRVAAFLERQANEGGLMHFYSYAKLLELAEIVEETKPLVCVELGSGGTTSVFADYVDRNAGCEVVTVDESQQFLDSTLSRLAAVGLAGKVRTMVCEPIETGNGARYEPRYLDVVGDRQIDLLYVDGPSPGGGRSIDPVWLGDSGRFPRRILYDYRIAGVRALMARPWAARYRAFLHFSADEGRAWVLGHWRHHSRFELRPECVT